jgi:hypothetical protein
MCKWPISGVTYEVAGNSPWELAISDKSAWSLIGPTKMTATVYLGGFNIATCVYVREAGLSGSYATGGQAILSLGAGQVFTKYSGSSEMCGSGMSLTGSFVPTSKGVPIWVTS